MSGFRLQKVCSGVPPSVYSFDVCARVMVRVRVTVKGLRLKG